jgi:hypothetical protein
MAGIPAGISGVLPVFVLFLCAGCDTDGGTKSGVYSEADWAALTAGANGAKAGVEISVDGTDKPSSVYWVTQSVMDTFTAAIGAAAGAVTDATDTALANAFNAFNAA